MPEPSKSIDLGAVSDQARRLIEEGQRATSMGFMQIGAGLDLAQTSGAIKAQGLNFESYVSQFGMRRATAYNALRVYRKFRTHNVTGIDKSRLIALLRNDIPVTQEVIDQAKVLGPADFYRAVQEKKGKPIPEICVHERTVTFCEVCRRKV